MTIPGNMSGKPDIKTWMRVRDQTVSCQHSGCHTSSKSQLAEKTTVPSYVVPPPRFLLSIIRSDPLLTTILSYARASSFSVVCAAREATSDFRLQLAHLAFAFLPLAVPHYTWRTQRFICGLARSLKHGPFRHASDRLG